MSDRLVIFLHGVGSCGADLSGLGQRWRAGLPNAAFAAPDGPEPFDQGGPGRQWFSVLGVTVANRGERIVAARTAFDRVIGGIITEQGFTDRLDRVALVGFSQGSIMALDAVVSGRWAVGKVVAFSGRLASPEPFTPAVATRIQLIHGTADPIMPVAELQSAERCLAAAGFQVTAKLLSGVGHSISADGAVLAEAFLADAAGSR